MAFLLLLSSPSSSSSFGLVNIYAGQYTIFYVSYVGLHLCNVVLNNDYNFKYSGQFVKCPEQALGEGHYGNKVLNFISIIIYLLCFLLRLFFFFPCFFDLVN